MKKKIFIILILILLISSLSFKKEIKSIISSTEIFSNIPTTLEDYYIKIPKINLLQPFYKKTSELNNVNKGIEQLSNCDSLSTCTLVLASHSGNSNISYFKNLNLLTINDQVIVYFKQKEYLYILKKIIYQEKIGFITIPKNTYDLVLTTCNKTNSNLQDIYLFTQI